MRYVMSELVDGSVNLDIMLLVLYVYLYGETTFLFARDSEDSNVKAPPKSRMTWCKTQHDACSGSPFESFAPETLLTNDQRQKDGLLDGVDLPIGEVPIAETRTAEGISSCIDNSIVIDHVQPQRACACTGAYRDGVSVARTADARDAHAA